MLQQYWEKHPVQYEIVQILREGEWVTHVFEWIFMMVSRFAGYLMTLAVGYLILYVIETKHSLETISVPPAFSDQVAIFSNAIVNVMPELVFTGVVVLCIRSFTLRRWLDGVLYLVTAVAFAILTMVLLNAFMSGQVTKDFLAVMLFWRAGAALFYTVVVSYCGGHGGMDFRTLLRELDTLRGQLDGGRQTVSSLQEQLSSVQQQLSTEQQEVSRLRRALDAEQKRASELQVELETGEGDVVRLRRELNAALVEVDTLRTQLEGKQREVEGLRETLESGQEGQGSRVSSLQQLGEEQAAAAMLRRQLNTALVDAGGLRAKLDAKQREVESVQAKLTTEQREVSTLRQQLDTVQASGGQGKVVRLDTNRPRKSGQDESAIAEQIRELLEKEPGISGRQIAARISCSPTTAAKWKQFFENGGQTSTECVNE